MLDLDRIHDQIPPGTGKVVQFLYQLEDQDDLVTISINGKVEIAVSDEGSFRMLVNLVDRLELLEALKQGMKELDEGKALSLEDVKEQARIKYGISL